YNTLNGKFENELPFLNKISISLRLLSFSPFLNVNRFSMVIYFNKYLLILPHPIATLDRTTNKKSPAICRTKNVCFLSI
ncbi:MAG: hypothetical protein ACR2KX_16395, partial [Chitinophagaceae bacterium]